MKYIKYLITISFIVFMLCSVAQNNIINSNTDLAITNNETSSNSGSDVKTVYKIKDISTSDNNEFEIKDLDINTEYRDLGPTYYLNNIVFASSGEITYYPEKLWNWKELRLLKLYIADKENLTASGIKPFINAADQYFDEGPASFTEDGKFMAFTRKNIQKNSKADIPKLQIFTSKKKDDGIWEKETAVNFNNPEYSVGHPSLTPDGNGMYFASADPNGLGGIDIYYVEKNENGEWGKPRNLGNNINTKGDEMFPFIHKSGVLFFASNGYSGYGGLDIYYSKLENGVFSVAKNIGQPVNGSFDDFALIIDNKQETGFFTSNREGGEGKDDIYSFKLLKELNFDRVFKGKTIDVNALPIADATVKLSDFRGNVIKTVNSDKNGLFIIEFDPKISGQIEVSHADYKTSLERINDRHINSEEIIVLEKKSPFSLLCVVRDDENRALLKNVNIVCSDNILNTDTKYITDEKGRAEIDLSDIKLNDSINFTFSVNNEKYIPKTLIYKDALSEKREYLFDIELHRLNKNEDLSEFFGFTPIYYDFDKYTIKPSAQIELDKLVKLLNRYPKMTLELSSYTDCRGTSEYNLILSNKRADEVLQYLKTRISNPERAVGKGYGETNLINNCCGSIKIKDSNCSEEEYGKNRRTEFKLLIDSD